MRGRFRRVIWAVLAALAALPGGCALGPRAIERTHGRYAAAVQRVDEEQLLRNLVRLRYVETPLHLDVASITAQYELSAAAEARPFFGTEAGTGPVFRSFSAVLPFASASASERPTVSLNPDDSGASVRRFLTPISTDTLVFLSQSGWPVGSLLRIWVDRMNGVPNVVPTGVRDVPADFERFRRACELIQAAQDRELMVAHAEERATDVSGPLPAEAVTAAAAVEAAKSGFEYQPGADGKGWRLIRRERRLVLQVNPAGRNSPEVSELVGLLHLTPGLERYEVAVAGGVPDPLKNPAAATAVLRVATRSTAQAYFFLASGVEVPPDHAARGLVRVPEGPAGCGATQGVFHVRSCKGGPPADAYVAVRYRDHWFYFDDRDAESKATLLLMLELSRLDFKRQQVGGSPTLTLPVGR
ncbi:MAG: hypothetical protein ACRC33_15610 [Gemmataceae bacterium]